jgi:hypothetical protein
MKFQFSIARFLMATAMVALIFGLARMLLDKQISSYVFSIAAVAADLGLLVLVAQKKSDLLRILRIIVGCFCYLCGSGVMICIFSMNFQAVAIGLLVLLPIGVSLTIVCIILSKIIKKMDAKERKETLLDEGGQPDQPEEI